jgi:hypothetical protein
MVYRLALVATLGLSALGCAFECTSEEAYGVELEITEEGGPREELITIRYRVDEGEWRTDARCVGRRLCVLGPELDGRYEIEVTRGPVTARAETTVAADRCHVLTETVPITLPDS